MITKTILSLTIISSVSTILHASSQSDSLMDDMIHWVRSEGGSFSEKLEIRRIDPKDPTSYFGVFAKTDIDPKESLMEIPQSCYIQIFDQAKDVGFNDTYKTSNHHHNVCLLSHKLMEEMDLDEQSRYAPYIAYLQTQKAGQIPVNWSNEGKDLLRKIMIPGSDAVDWIDLYYKDSCIDGDDDFEVHMMEMTIQRGFDAALIPIWDMVNHDNGRLNTENNSMYDEEGLKVQAARKIKAGEEIFATYDMCVDCGDEAEDAGTPEILRDFGFVEGYPHRWYFAEEDLWFVVKEEGTEGPRVEWVPEGAVMSKGDELDVEDIMYLQKELDRLVEVGNGELSEYRGRLPLGEWSMILNYYEAARTDLRLAIEQATANLNAPHVPPSESYTETILQQWNTLSHSINFSNLFNLSMEF